ncbi:hypothetical protein KY333_01670 [Candidatus Woesearchaeota archaeon]|nr:hypothetical protein [Candidatus Woesearchaeota archaeon]MBW2994519.1 hypothetical protein [Candidatus Woesearchaeota archaeon]
MGLKQDIIYAAACISLGLFAGREIGIYNSNNNQKPQVVYHQTLPKEETNEEVRQSLRDTISAQYESAKAADGIKKGLQELGEKISEMSGNYEGTPGLPGKTGISDLFDGPKKKSTQYQEMKKTLDSITESVRKLGKEIQEMGRNYEGGPGLPSDPGFGNLFPGPGQKKKSDSGNDNEKKSDEDTQRPLKDSHERFDRTYKKIQEDLKSAHEYVRQIHENAEAGRKALEDGRRALQGSSGGSLNLPDVPIIPNFPNTPKIDKDKKEEKK